MMNDEIKIQRPAERRVREFPIAIFLVRGICQYEDAMDNSMNDS